MDFHFQQKLDWEEAAEKNGAHFGREFTFSGENKRMLQLMKAFVVVAFFSLQKEVPIKKKSFPDA